MVNFDSDFGHAAADGGYLDPEFRPVTPDNLHLVRAGDASARRELEGLLWPHLSDLAAQPLWEQAGIPHDEALRMVIAELRAENYGVVGTWVPSKKTLARHVTREIERILSTRQRAIDINKLRACLDRAELRDTDRALLILMDVEKKSAKEARRVDATRVALPRPFESDDAVRQAHRRARCAFQARCHEGDREFVRHYLSTVRRRG